MSSAEVRMDIDVLYVNGTFACAVLIIPTGTVKNTHVAADAAIARTKLEQNALRSFPIPLTDFRVHDAMQTNLPGTPASDDLGLIGGTFGTNVPMLKTNDLKAAGATTLRARALVRLPAEYDPGESVQVRIKGGMQTTVSDTTATVDVEAFKSDKEGAVDGSDLCTAAAQSINSLTAANKDFALTSALLNPGDWLDVRISVAVNDAATATAVVAALGSIELLCDIKG